MGCGICGFVGLSDRELLKKMCEAIKYRGPDSTGFFVDDGVGLGIDRLKIIDIYTGDQPIRNEDGSVWAVLNGEIYNYIELRQTLESAGHRFYTRSDTETIVHAYEEWGDRCVERFRGMFAIALWDSKRKRLFLARDRFGKKPLYYSLVDGVLLFSSEIKSILLCDLISRAIDYEAMDHYFSYLYVPSPLTIFKDVRKLSPGHYAVFTGGSFEVTQYWDVRFRPDLASTEDSFIDRLYAALTEAVKIRLRSDVPVGAFLSGGVDSSSVAAIMKKVSQQPVKTVSIGFDEGVTELQYAKTVSEFLGTDHREYVVTPSAYSILPSLVSHFDEPFADTSFIPTYYLSKVTREQVTVALSGDGGDELFMGYPFMTDPSSFALYSKVPAPIRRPILRALRAIPGESQVRRMADHAYEKDYGDQPAVERYAMRVTTLDPTGVARLYSREFRERRTPVDTYQYLLNLSKMTDAKDPLDVIDYLTIKSYLSEGILTKVDRMSMAVALEVRAPLLDQEVMDVVGTIPSSMKLKGGETKYIFKKMAVQKGLIPREIAYRAKQGFGAPVEAWMRGNWSEFVQQTLDPVVTKNYTGFFDKDRVRQMLADPTVHSQRIFALVVFLIWYKMYIDEQSWREVSVLPVM